MTQHVPDTEKLTFPGSTGAELAGVLHHPDAAARGSCVLAHCFTCSKDLHTMTRLSRGLATAGYAVLRFDFTGLGASGGEFSKTTVSHDVRDVVQAATALVQRSYGPCALVGHSLGGAAALLAAGRLHLVRSVAVIGAPSRPDHVRRHFRAQEPEIRRQGEAVVEVAGRPFPLSVKFLDDLARHDQAGAVAELGRPLLVVHAVDDEVVPIEEGERIFAAARQPKGFEPLPGTDHLMTPRASAEQALAVLTSWFDRTL